jgi:hypothetical protein
MPAKIMYKVHPHGTPTLYTEVGPTFSVAGSHFIGARCFDGRKGKRGDGEHSWKN